MSQITKVHNGSITMKTGVYFSFDYNEPSNDDEDLLREQYVDFENTNFAFNINFIRPRFFGKECFPIVDKMSEDLNLFIFNPQNECEPKKYAIGHLEGEWAETNFSLAMRNFKEFELCYLESEKSDNSWIFNLNRKRLQESLWGQLFCSWNFLREEEGNKSS